jgi:glycosyltransferase involved in cell wall biosynthesis
MITRKKNGPKRIGFISTRISGTDGVSLEIEKWAAVLEAMGHSCFYIAGLCDDRPPERCHIIPEAHFRHPEVEAVNAEAFGMRLRSPALSHAVRALIARIDEHLRAAIEGFSLDDILVLQPTRIVQRKGIETTIELVRRLDDPRIKLVISHAAGDEGASYVRRVAEYAALLGVELILAGDLIDAGSGAGSARFSIWDAYAEADLVTYPSTYEGFGNAFLEAVYHKKPILCNRYSIFRTDIEPLGFNTIEIDGFLTDEVLAEVRRVLDDAEYRHDMVEQNYRIGLQHFSYRRVADEMASLLSAPHLVSRGLDPERCFSAT